MKNNISTLSSKGQITIPNIVRSKLNLSQGSKFEFISCEGFIMMVPINQSVNNLQGMLTKPKKSLTIDKINNIIKGLYDRD